MGPVLSAAMVLAVSGASCGGGPDALTRVHDAAKALEKAGGFHVRPVYRVEMPEGYQASPFPSGGEGSVDLGRDLATVRFTGADGSAWTTERIGDTIYTSGGAVADGPDWCASRASRGDPASDAGGLAQLGQSFDVMPALLSGATEAHELGPAADPAVTRYATTVDLRAAGLTAAADAVGDKLAVEVWVDEAGLPVRISYGFDISFEGAPTPAKVALAITMSDFGTGVSVAPPAAAEVATAPDC
jgi:hypothetical protein